MRHNEFPHPAYAVALGAGRRLSADVVAGRVGAGQIAFSDQLTAGETVTVNGKVFTAKANGAVGDQFNIGAALTNTLDNLAAVLNASVYPEVAQATYANGAGTKLTVTLDQPSADAFEIESDSAVATVTAVTGGVGTDPIKLDAETYAITTIAGAASNVTLPNGEEGQEVTVYLAVKGAGANAVVNGVFAGGTKITLDAAGKYFRAKFLGASWVVLNNTGTLA